MWVTGLLIYLGVGLQLRGLVVLYNDKQLNRTLNAAIVAAPYQTIVTDIWWLPLNATPIYPQKEIYLVNDASLPEWIGLAQTHQLSPFLLITFDETMPRRLRQLVTSGDVQIREARQFGHFLFFTLTMTP
jgi:hypothetical protein